MSKEFEEAKLVITADIVYDPDGEEITTFVSFVHDYVGDYLENNDILFKNLNVKLEHFTCEQ